MSSTVVQVKNISHETSDKEVRDFFSFCGKISSLSVKPVSGAADSTQSATVTFEKETAAKTALLLDGTQLGPSQVQVSSAASLGDLASSAAHAVVGDKDTHDDDISQEDKPRSRIVAEYLAHGYGLSDAALEKALALDQKHGVSSRFTTFITQIDDRFKATDKARGIDNSYGITDKATQGWRGLNSYFEKALGTPTGQKLAAFYTKGNQEVIDIHTEARRLADLKLKSGKTSGGSYEANKKSLKNVSGTDKTTCQCAGNAGTCPCNDGQCACSGCGKSTTGFGEKTATGKADKIAESSGLAPLGEKS